MQKNVEEGKLKPTHEEPWTSQKRKDFLNQPFERPKEEGKWIAKEIGKRHRINKYGVDSVEKPTNAKKAGTTVQEEKEALKKPVKTAVEETTKPTTRTIRDRRSRAAVAAVGVGDECITLPLPASLNHAAQPPETASISPPPESYTKGDANADTNTNAQTRKDAMTTLSSHVSACRRHIDRSVCNKASA